MRIGPQRTTFTLEFSKLIVKLFFKNSFPLPLFATFRKSFRYTHFLQKEYKYFLSVVTSFIWQLHPFVIKTLQNIRAVLTDWNTLFSQALRAYLIFTRLKTSVVSVQHRKFFLDPSEYYVWTTFLCVYFSQVLILRNTFACLNSKTFFMPRFPRERVKNTLRACVTCWKHAACLRNCKYSLAYFFIHCINVMRCC